MITLFLISSENLAESLKISGEFIVKEVDDIPEILSNDTTPAIIYFSPGIENPIRKAQQLYSKNKNLFFIINVTSIKEIEKDYKHSYLSPQNVRIISETDPQVITNDVIKFGVAFKKKIRSRTALSSFDTSTNHIPSPGAHIKDYLNELLEYLPVGVMVSSKEGIIEAWNRKAAEIFNTDFNVKKNITEIFPSKISGFLENASMSKNGSMTELFSLDAYQKIIELTACRSVGQTGEEGYLLIFSDVTEREHISEELRRTNQRLKRAEESSMVIITHLDLEGKWIKVPKSFSDLMGYSREELLNMNMQSVTHPDDLKNELPRLEKLFNGEIDSYEIQKRYIKKDGSIIWVYLNRSVVKDEQNNPLHFLTFVIDITKYKKNEELVQSYYEELKELNHSKDKLLSILSHDIKSPLHSVKNLSGLISENFNDLEQSEIIDITSAINSSAQHLLLLLDNLLDWTNFRSGKIPFTPVKIDIKDKIDFIFNLLKIKALNKKINLQNNIPPYSYACADEKMFLSVLQNLISNGIKFTHKEGSVEASLEDFNDHWNIEIKDNGVGISQEILQLILKENKNISTAGTEDERGTGLGLIITQDFVQKNGGTIEVVSKEHEGSTFKFTVPKFKKQ
jgi:PAS domain S-box-containing protein